MDYLGCGIIRVDEVKNVVYFTVNRFSDIFDKIVPFFTKYELKGDKKQNFADFCLVANLMKELGSGPFNTKWPIKYSKN